MALTWEPISRVHPWIQRNPCRDLTERYDSVFLLFLIHFHSFNVFRRPRIFAWQGMSGPIFGVCPGSRDWIRESSGNPYTGKDWIRAPPDAPKHLDDTDDVMTQLALKKIEAFSGIGHGFFFWNFRSELDVSPRKVFYNILRLTPELTFSFPTPCPHLRAADLYEPQWSYMGKLYKSLLCSLLRSQHYPLTFSFRLVETLPAALDRGWIPKGNLHDSKIYDACRREDDNDFKCVLKRGQLDTNIRGAMTFIFNTNNTFDAPESQTLLNLTGSNLEAAAQGVIGEFFEQNRLNGVTCDFGGIAMLVERNRTITDDDSLNYNDDSYFRVVNKGPSVCCCVDCAHVIICGKG